MDTRSSGALPHRDEPRAPIHQLRAVSGTLDRSIHWAQEQKVARGWPSANGITVIEATPRAIGATAMAIGFAYILRNSRAAANDMMDCVILRLFTEKSSSSDICHKPTR
ncbi:MAG: hypothetical protein EOO38_01610 [Cytophagaceae bacterium]|nr:MAG: hypothetical protein EOO38_01610 [Cytophagaceae bacterium]